MSNMWPPDSASNGKPRTALVLSAGAMFGAYQAGVWQALASRFTPDVVIGASVGSLNGWAIAGGMTPDALADRWLHLQPAASLRLRWPRTPRDGYLEAAYLAEWVRELHTGLQPRCGYGAVLTRLRPFRPELFTTPDITWQHLAGSCAMPFLYPHYRLGGATYTDGGLLEALPLWAAARMGCERVIAVDLLPVVPIPGARWGKSLMRRISGHRYAAPEGTVLMIEPSRPLGGMKDFILWRRSNAERWIEQGRRDAESAMARMP